MFGNRTTNTTTATLNTSLSSFPPYDLDYARFFHTDDGMLAFYSWSTIFSFVGSCLCFILNAYLLHCLLTTDEFKNLFFFPIGLQALIDMIGPGLSNFVNVIVSLHKFRTALEYSAAETPEVDSDIIVSIQILSGIFSSVYSRQQQTRRERLKSAPYLRLKKRKT